MFTEAPISLSVIKKARDLAFSMHSNERSYPTHRSVNEYEKTLPNFQGQTFVQHIENRRSEVNVLDIGCGQGALLASLKARYPNLRVFGLSAHDYRSEYSFQNLLSGVDYIVGDAQRLRSHFRDTKFDIVVSLYTFEYLADPLAALKQAYMLCNEGGIVFIDKFTTLKQHEAKLLGGYLRQQVVEANLKRFAPEEARFDPSMYSLAIQRGPSRRLHLPFRYNGSYITPETDRMGTNTPGIRLSYSFDEALVLAENSLGANPVSSQ